MEAQDRTIKCASCGREFIFTVKEQAFFASKDFKEPRHCRECRQQRKQSQVQVLDQALSGPPAVRIKEMFKIVCGNCKRETLVPFRPILGKPVLCKDCFIAQRYGVTTAAAREAAQKKAALGAEKPVKVEEAPPAPPPSGDVEKTETPAPSVDLQEQPVPSSSPPDSEQPPITEQSPNPEPQKLAAKEPNTEP